MEDKALLELFRDMLDYKKKEARFLFIALISVIVINLLMVGAFLYFISNMEATTTTTTTTQTVDGEENEIFSTMKARMLEGMVFHDEMSRYFDFLNLPGYRYRHRKHYEEETKGYQKLCEYYMNHFNKLIPTNPMDRPDIIPDSWYKYARTDVDAGTKRSAVKTAVEKWVEWETETKNIFEEMCGELLNNGEIASYEFLSRYVKDVDEELKEAYSHHIALETIGYDLSFILCEQ